MTTTSLRDRGPGRRSVATTPTLGDVTSESCSPRTLSGANASPPRPPASTSTTQRTG